MRHIFFIQSSELSANIFQMEWLTLDQSGKGSLLIIMNRSLVPIEFSCAYILTMNLGSFVSVSISNHCHVEITTIIVFRKINNAHKMFLMHIFLEFFKLQYIKLLFSIYKNQFVKNILIIMTIIIRIFYQSQYFTKEKKRKEDQFENKKIPPFFCYSYLKHHIRPTIYYSRYKQHNLNRKQYRDQS